MIILDNDKQAKKMISNVVTDYVTNYQLEHTVETRWGNPLIGIADARDSLFSELKEIIGPNHSLPEEILTGAKSVIAIFVPFAREIIESNIAGIESSREWDYAYIETNHMLEGLTKNLYYFLVSKGYKSSDMPQTYNYDSETIKCGWSHRSAAYIAGLGSFGINNMLITEKGCCGRLTSVITDWEIEPDARKSEEACLYKRNGSCMACISRCPSKALLIESGSFSYDLDRCYNHIYECNIHEWPIGTTDTCGKCLVGVPCSWQRP